MTRKKFNKAEFIRFCKRTICWKANLWTDHYDLEAADRRLSERCKEEDLTYSDEGFEEMVLRYFPSLEAYELYRDFMDR